MKLEILLLEARTEQLRQPVAAKNQVERKEAMPVSLLGTQKQSFRKSSIYYTVAALLRLQS